MGYDIEPGDLFFEPASRQRSPDRPVGQTDPRCAAPLARLRILYRAPGLSVPATGYASSAAILAFSNVRFGIGGDYGNDGNGWNGADSGFAQFHISLPLNLASGTRVRLGVMEKPARQHLLHDRCAL